MLLTNALLFFLSMLLLAAIPSVSVALVISIAASQGFRQGAAAAAGIVAGDLLFVAIALLGIGALAHTFAPYFTLFQATAALYLLYTGISLLRSANTPSHQTLRQSPRRTTSSFLAGFLLTLADIKAILFYAALFPAFFDLSTLRAPHITLIALLTIIAVGGIKLLYALAASKAASRWLPNRASPCLTRLAALLMLAAATILLTKLILRLT